MNLLMPSDTRTALGPNAERCESRSLFMDRFANPLAKDDSNQHPRRDWFKALIGKGAIPSSSESRCEWLAQTATSRAGQVLYAQLQSRLMVNMAGGVMENAGLCLDRFGLPFIPGSAGKGCARRAALAALHEWCDTGSKPLADDNLFTPACASFHSPTEMLAGIARVFGWGEQDWKSRTDFRTDDDWRKKRSDFAWACEPTSTDGASQLPGNAPHLDASPQGRAQPLRKGGWTATCDTVVCQLARELGISIKDQDPTPWKRLPNFAGSVSFLPAYSADFGRVAGLPLEAPEFGKLELDVVTCHHPDYYGHKKNERGELIMPIALDSEQRILPIIFPAIAPGHIFAFALLPLRDCGPELLNHARTWLVTGLQIFGLGAKAAAGYGLFQDVSIPIRHEYEALRSEREAKEKQRKLQAERDTARANLQPDLDLIEKLRGLKEPDLRGQINPFATEERFWTLKDERVQLTILHFLFVTAPDLFTADRTKPSSKIAKAITHLSAKFPHVRPTKP